MRKALVIAIALAVVAVPAAATATTTAVKPAVISINVVNGRPAGGISRPSVKKGRTVRDRRSHDCRHGCAPARLRHREVRRRRGSRR